MRTFSNCSLGLLLLMTLTSEARAADWTGPYLGVSLGEGEIDHGVTLGGSPDTQAVIGLGVLPATAASRASGVIGGGEVGYDYHLRPFLLGVVADFSGANISKSQSTSTAVPGFFAFTTTARQSIDWFGTARLRAGATIADNFLVYATGGLAYAQIKTSESVTDTTPPVCAGVCTSSSLTSTKLGRAVGAGLQYALTDHFSIKGEWLNYDLGTTRLVGTSQFPGTFITFTTRLTGNVYRVGGDFKF